MAVAEIRPDWTVGTLTLVGGSKDFTTNGSALETAAIQAGDEIITQSGLTLIIATITGQNSGTLMEDCPAGAAGVDQPLRIRFQPDGSRYNGATADLVQLLGSGNVYAFAGLNGSADKIPMFSGAGTLTLIDKLDLVNGVKFNALVDTLADRDAYDNEVNGFVVMVADVGDGRSAIYFKNSDAAGDWSDAAYVTGPAGGLSSIEVGSTTTLPAGSNATVTNSGTPTEPVLEFGIPAGVGFYSKGDYSAATQYNAGDVVQYNGSSFVAIVATQGNPPPATPATSNSYWNLLAKMGEGGDMFKAVYDPTNQSRDIFAAINDKTSMYDSVAVAEAATIPSNINAIMLAGYYAAGDGGFALYRRVATEPNHVGKLQSFDGAWWEISVDDLYLKQLGAIDGADVADIIKSALVVGKKIVVDGSYIASKEISHSGGVHIIGASDTAEIHWPADAVSGGFNLTATDWYDYFEIRGVRLTTAAVALWNAVAINWSSLGVSNIPFFWVRARIMSNRIMGAMTAGGVNNTNVGWLNGVRLDYPFSVEIMDNYIFGAWDGSYQTNGMNAFKSYAGIYIPDQSQRTLAYLRMERNSIFFSKYGVQQYNIEGTWFVDNDIQVAWRGLHYQNTISPVNQHRIYGNHIGVYETQIMVINSRQVLIENNEISYRYGRTDGQSVSLVVLDGVVSGSVVGNSIRGNVFNTSDVSVSGILLINNNRALGNTRHISIDVNQFQNLAYAYQIRASAIDNNIGPSNSFDNMMTGVGVTVDNTSIATGVMGSGTDPLPAGQRPALYLRNKSAASLAVSREASDGYAVSFFRSGALVGGIALTGTTTTYHTSSDSSLKTSKGELTFEDASRIIEMTTIHSFNWNSNGADDVGVFAQELYEVYPNAVFKGGWFMPDGSEVSEGVSGSTYTPWSVDYSKLVPVMMRALQGVISREAI